MKRRTIICLFSILAILLIANGLIGASILIHLKNEYSHDQYIIRNSITPVRNAVMVGATGNGAFIYRKLPAWEDGKDREHR